MTNVWSPASSNPSAIAALGGDVTGTVGANTVVKLRGRPITATAPTDGQVYQYVAANSDWEPTGGIPTTGLLAWFDVSDTSTVNAGNPANGDSITTLHDKSGNGHDATGAGDDLPIYVANLSSVFPEIGCNLPAATAGFKSANVSWFNLPLTLLGGLSSISIVGVFLPVAASTVVHAEWTGGLNPTVDYAIGGAHDWMAAWAISQVGNSLCFPWSTDPADGLGVSVAPLPPTATVCRIGDDGSGTGQACLILAEMFFYGRALHAGETQAIRNYLSAKWTAI